MDVKVTGTLTQQGCCRAGPAGSQLHCGRHSRFSGRRGLDSGGLHPAPQPARARSSATSVLSKAGRQQRLPPRGFSFYLFLRRCPSNTRHDGWRMAPSRAVRPASPRGPRPQLAHAGVPCHFCRVPFCVVARIPAMTAPSPRPGRAARACAHLRQAARRGSSLPRWRCAGWRDSPCPCVLSGEASYGGEMTDKAGLLPAASWLVTVASPRDAAPASLTLEAGVPQRPPGTPLAILRAWTPRLLHFLLFLSDLLDHRF